MPFLSDSLARVKPSPTVSLTGRVAALRASGRKIIGLGTGEPDFDTPEHIKSAAIKAMADGHTKYTAPDGIAPLKAAIVEKFARENALHYRPEEIIVGGGGKHVIYNALVATLNPGDEVIIPAPFWVSYPDMVLLGAGVPRIVDCALTGFKITPALLEAAITPATKWLILNSPSNPTGAAYTADELRALSAVLERHPHVWIMSDDIYEHISYPPFKFTTIAAISPVLASRTLTVNGVSKAYAMTGWRIGYAGGPRDLIGAMVKLQTQSTTNPSSISQYAALAALNGPQDYLAEARGHFARRRDLIVGLLNACQGIDCAVPEGAFYVYPSIARIIGKTTRSGSRIATDEDFVTALLEETGVAVVHGAAFGGSPNFRVSYATSDAILTEAGALIAEFCASLK